MTHLKKNMLVLIGMFILVIGASFLLDWNASVYAANTGTITASNLSVRKGPGISYDRLKYSGKYVTLKKNATVTISKEKNDWYYITFKYNGKTLKGYVKDDYVKIKSTSSTTSSTASNNTKKYNVSATSTASNVYVRKTPGTTGAKLTVSKVVVKLKKKQKVKVLNCKTVKSKKWYYISLTYKSKTRYGWVLSDNIKLTLSQSVKATVNNSSTKVRTKASSKATYLKVSKKTVSLKKSLEVKITKETTVSKVKWFKISFFYSGKTRTGYITADKLTFKKTQSTAAAAKPTPTPTKMPESTGASPQVLTDEQFEAAMTAEGFPETYKPALRELHKKYPYWQFKTYQTNLDWETVILNENKPGKNLISKGGTTAGTDTYAAYKSFMTGAYDWKTDKFIVWDGSSWVTPSEVALRYYMDPRNFLDEKRIFQFELLSYQKSYQTQTAVQKMLAGTPLDTSFSYKEGSSTVTKNYAETFMAAAQYSGVSPYHLVSRVKQEVFTSSSGKIVLSGSASGTYAGYVGYYNFFNIGATSAAGGGAVANGLTYAKNGTSSATKNETYMIPWTNQYRSIVGGSYFIGSSYISVGQNSIYLQKFSVTPVNTYTHQYMQNVQAPYAEGEKMSTAYAGLTDVPIVFSIPVFLNMPQTASPLPTTVLNPNNWLKTLSVSGYSLTPTFNLSKDQEYSLIVDNSVTSVTIAATTVSKKAVISGAGIVNLAVGDNVITVAVTAESGAVRNYIIHIVRNS